MLLIALSQGFVSEDPPFANSAKDGAPAKPNPREPNPRKANLRQAIGPPVMPNPAPTVLLGDAGAGCTCSPQK